MPLQHLRHLHPPDPDPQGGRHRQGPELGERRGRLLVLPRGLHLHPRRQPADPAARPQQAHPPRLRLEQLRQGHRGPVPRRQQQRLPAALSCQERYGQAGEHYDPQPGRGRRVRRPARPEPAGPNGVRRKRQQWAQGRDELSESGRRDPDDDGHYAAGFGGLMRRRGRRRDAPFWNTTYYTPFNT